MSITQVLMHQLDMAKLHEDTRIAFHAASEFRTTNSNLVHVGNLIYQTNAELQKTAVVSDGRLLFKETNIQAIISILNSGKTAEFLTANQDTAKYMSDCITNCATATARDQNVFVCTFKRQNENYNCFRSQKK